LTPRSSTPSPLPIPTLLSSSLPRKRPSSASVRRRVQKDSGHRWTRRRCQAEESSCRRHSASSPTTPASSPSSPAVEHFLSASAGEPVCSEVDDGRAPLDSNPAATYRFGSLSELTSGSRSSGLNSKMYPAGRNVIWAGPFGNPRRGPVLVRIRPANIFIFPPVF
jgi:hypothetical protein